MAAAELLLPIPEPLAEPLVLAEPPLLLVSDDMPLEPLPLVLLPLMPDELEPEPEDAVFSFGWPVALSRQWVAGDTELEPEADGLLLD